ncbi:hypothetical protein A7U60_g7511 [Sanghuangporus baumii]|uniref:Uncharacterized protein n=1 Tax=Sanghuangporus baumii TaxID=108892 RepID=A0A9Q5N541_SANBA|nr:hypothetical protein A7U60_g7511 [Sanghuangporus baumii]
MSLFALVADYASNLVLALWIIIVVYLLGHSLQTSFRSKLRVYSSSMMLSKVNSSGTRNRYYEKHKFGVAFIIDIIRSFFIRFMMSTSDLFSTALLSALSQASDGSWADLSILGEDDEVEEGINGPESALNATVNGIISKVACIPAATQEDILEDLTACGVIDPPPKRRIQD